MIKFVIVAASVFSALSLIDQGKTATSPPESQYTLQDLVQAVSNATDASGMVSTPTIMDNLQNPSSPSVAHRGLSELVAAVQQCEAEGNLTYENFTEKFTR